MGGGLAAEAPRPEDRFPKLVVRSATAEAPAATGAKKEDAPPKIGTVSVPNDRFKVDPRKYEITYVQIDQAFTTNLVDGSGFPPVGIKIGRAHVCTPVTNAQLVCRLLL